ncbi:NAD(P)-dependent oxidoreductase [Geobacillus sp. 44B]|jgi:3-hydroxyisobutyrate dehydrogenase|uniref:2-hydroxy-3-oxopropionate reductase n=2 Tax=Saccharococcus caldoxylosilyticus TaxID=81408 RepID=A0A150LU45_9BACL|nr:2-hydroxy-3-oxopropionate reductase [Parageobacillus caldoxylosilyticus]OQP02550.1 3-hydroxyisobutyrate dehydrogenase [Geobacillus sp. 44B]GAJ41128.1 putative 2-hydroxy-3-oxopropionate reductase [Parageobacillus caldoxylosilyticus NBRC 107762]MBB3851587.1 3-hydroxyisobutyrate dehydrogenase [Parageobacillus caldoxylosilyticus]QNU37412.1 NAD(P)-dependent oxidoreductase [Geobacillus sp. 44B]
MDHYSSGEARGMKVGFIGTGVMGTRMVKRLLGAGYQVTVYNRSIEKTKPLVKMGANRADTIAELARHSNVICTCLSMPDDVIDVYLRKDGVIDHAGPGTICLDFTTVGPDTSKTVAKRAQEKDIYYLDAPVSGGPEGAEQGTLTIMVGGAKPAWEQALPLLNVLGETVEYLGESGAGSAAKLINQYLVAVHSVAASEAMVAGTAFGLDAEQLYRILKVSYGDSRMLRRHMEQYVLPRRFTPGGAVKYVHKDVRLANELMKEMGMKQFLGQMAEAAFSLAMQQGLSNLDMSAVIQLFEQQCNVTVKKENE